MALVILGGLVTATLINLFVLPALYLRFGKSRKERRAASAQAATAWRAARRPPLSSSSQPPRLGSACDGAGSGKKEDEVDGAAAD